MLNAIADRRSIRSYKDKAIPRQLVDEIIKAGMLAPSSKNRQPWEFVVVTGESKKEMLKVFQTGLEREKNAPLLPESARYLSGAEYTLSVMRQAPVVIFVINSLGLGIDRPLTPEERVYEICNAQSIGAAVENMALAATELGLGSLWVCDTYFAHRELCDWLRAGCELAAAIAIGYTEESPAPRPRKRVDETVEWRN